MKGLVEYIDESGSAWSCVNAGFGGINIMSDDERLVCKLMSKIDLNKPYSRSYKENMTWAVRDAICGVTSPLRKGKLWKGDVPFEFKTCFNKAVNLWKVDPEDLLKVMIGFCQFDKDTVEILTKEKINVEDIPGYIK